MKKEAKIAALTALILTVGSAVLFVYQEYFYYDYSGQSFLTGLFFFSVPVALSSLAAIALTGEQQGAWRKTTLRWVVGMVLLMLYLPTTGSGILSVTSEDLGIVFALLLSLRYAIFFIRKK